MNAADNRLIDPDEALRLVLHAAQRRRPRPMPPVEACGLQLAESIRADRDYPPFDRAVMDGVAVRTCDAGTTVTVAGEVAAGDYVTTEVVPGSCLEIMTGAACPVGAEAIVPKEEIHRDVDRTTLPHEIEPGQYIAPKGCECRQGTTVLQTGRTVTPLAVAVMASFGVESVEVIPRPSMGVITTGGELIPPGREPAPAQIRDSNGPMLVAMARDMGVDRPPHLHAEDCIEAIVSALKEVADRDVIVLTGGVSVGTYDLVPAALEAYGAEQVFHKVTQKPGKPLLVAKKGQQLLFGLPGNPLAVHLCFYRYVAAAIRAMEGKPPTREPIAGRLAEPIEPKTSRTFFVPAHADRAEGDAPRWRIHPLPGVSSADVFTSSQANCYARVPPGTAAIPAGEILELTWIGSAPWPN